LPCNAFRDDVCLLRDSQAAELGQRKQFATSGPNATDTSAGLGADFGGFLVTASGAELQDFLDTDAQGLQLLPDYVFSHLPRFLTDVHKDSPEERCKTHTVPTIMGSQCDDRGSEAVRGYWEKPQTCHLICAEIPPYTMPVFTSESHACP